MKTTTSQQRVIDRLAAGWILRWHRGVLNGCWLIKDGGLTPSTMIKVRSCVAEALKRHSAIHATEPSTGPGPHLQYYTLAEFEDLDDWLSNHE